MIVYRLLYTKRRAKEAEKPKAKSLRSHGRMGDESEVKIKHVEDYNQKINPINIYLFLPKHVLNRTTQR